MRSAILAAVLLVMAAERVDARCSLPFWAGSASVSIPVRGSLYVYSFGSETRPPVEVEWSGPAGAATQTRIADDVLRIDYEGHAGAGLRIHYAMRDYTYELRDDWRAADALPQVTWLWHDSYEWTCSSSDLVHIRLDQPTAAIRARWMAAGKTREWILPSPESSATSEVKLGSINCGGTNIPPAELALGGHLDLWAIRFDGTEVRVEGIPPRLMTSAMWKADYDYRTPAETGTERSWQVLGAFVALGMGVSAAFALRRARVRPGVPV